MYHAGVVKLTQRLSDSLLFQGSYTYSKLMTNADVFSGSGGSMDTAQPELEYSIGRLDQPHSIRLNTVLTLPWGPDRKWLNSGVLSHILGGWRVATVQSYSSGLPIGVTGPAPLAIFNGTNRPNVTGADWRWRPPATSSIPGPIGISIAPPSSRPWRSWAMRRASTAMCGGPGIWQRT